MCNASSFLADNVYGKNNEDAKLCQPLTTSSLVRQRLMCSLHSTQLQQRLRHWRLDGLKHHWGLSCGWPIRVQYNDPVIHSSRMDVQYKWCNTLYHAAQGNTPMVYCKACEPCYVQWKQHWHGKDVLNLWIISSHMRRAYTILPLGAGTQEAQKKLRLLHHNNCAPVSCTWTLKSLEYGTTTSANSPRVLPLNRRGSKLRRYSRSAHCSILSGLIVRWCPSQPIELLMSRSTICSSRTVSWCLSSSLVTLVQTGRESGQRQRLWELGSDDSKP